MCDHGNCGDCGKGEGGKGKNCGTDVCNGKGKGDGHCGGCGTHDAPVNPVNNPGSPCGGCGGCGGGKKEDEEK